MFKHLVKTKRKGTFATEREAWNNVKRECAIIEPTDTETNPKNETTIIPETEIPEAVQETETLAALQVQHPEPTPTGKIQQRNPNKQLQLISSRNSGSNIEPTFSPQCLARFSTRK
jgi:hypothetical protein